MLALWREKAHWFFRGPHGRSPLNSALEWKIQLRLASFSPVLVSSPVTCSWDPFPEAVQVHKQESLCSCHLPWRPRRHSQVPHLAMPEGRNAGSTWHLASQFWRLLSAVTLCPRIIIPKGWEQQALCWLGGSAILVEEMISLSELEWGSWGGPATFSLVEGKRQTN